MNISNNRISTISNHTKHDDLVTIRSRTSPVRNRKRNIIWILITLIASVFLILGIAIPLTLFTRKKVDSSRTMLPSVTTTTTVIPSTTKIKSTRTTRPRTTTLRTTRIRKITEKPPKTARPSDPSSSSCTIS
ncbi:unnamed protein product [Adineta steineri]|uniref:Uncharacterized protein n=1 Tax=Adineta steineri TaxID=433720 RepID=A0A819XYX4_9BILA|nr:unnamed protein product [Adineta steineri]CAF3619918.1 unnamed protein product [Adineta steineri]CAF4042387.1 unnamed protein product [Adineta steineri]CAF4149573.1 unnamed protein product [Adineta steineri]